MATLTSAIYGKDKVRVFRVVRTDTVHEIAEYNVRAILGGDISTSFTQADNSVVVATDSIKNTIYILAKKSPYILDPVLFALHLGIHFVQTYPHIHQTHISIEKLKWSRIALPGKIEGHKHSFVRDGDEKRTVEVHVDGAKNKAAPAARIAAGLKDLLLLKTTGSAFEGFIQDDYTTLLPVSDRILSTAVDTSYNFPPSPGLTIDGLAAYGAEYDFESVAQKVRDATIELFAEDESASVQATLYNTAQRVLRDNPKLVDITYRLPNKHYIPVNLSFFHDTQNVSPPNVAEVFMPTDSPSGIIKATVSRTS